MPRSFRKLGITVPALPGRMVIFHNTTHDISGPHPLSLHAGMPVEAGEKWAFNMWFRLQDTTTEFEFGGVLPTVSIGLSDTATNEQLSSANDPQTSLTNPQQTKPTTPTSREKVSSSGITVRANRADTVWQRAANNLRAETKICRPCMQATGIPTATNHNPRPPKHGRGRALEQRAEKCLTHFQISA